MTGRGEGGNGEQAGTPDGWPVSLRGVTESVVTTRGPNDRWNVAALGLHAPDKATGVVTAKTWGNTRTRRNFHRRGGGVIQFVSDPREFVSAAMTIREEDDPVLDAAHAWVEVEVTRIDGGERGGTRWEEWELRPHDSTVVSKTIPTINRGFAAVIDATVAASRLDVPAYDTDELLSQLQYFAETVEKCGGAAEKEAFDTIDEVSGWRERIE
ncbi:DUF447 domain-containing protein [Halogeometricum borinquense]|uniref:DUF447 domain-containing protein n=1 Tax=Halogeometricum borinquense TaxID=60847 RepID=UPI00343DFF55